MSMKEFLRHVCICDHMSREQFSPHIYPSRSIINHRQNEYTQIEIGMEEMEKEEEEEEPTER